MAVPRAGEGKLTGPILPLARLLLLVAASVTFAAAHASGADTARPPEPPASIPVPEIARRAEEVTNWTHSDRMRRIDVPVGVAYGSAPDAVLRLLVEVARANPEVVVHPPPLALFPGFGDSALKFELRVWTDRFERWIEIRSDLGVALYAALRDAGMEIPFPQQDVRLRREPPAAPDSAG